MVWKKILKKRKIIKLASFIVLLLLLLGGFLFYRSDNIFEYGDIVMGFFTLGTPSEMYFYALNKLFIIEDELNPFRIKKNLLYGDLPIYDLRLSRDDILHFENLSAVGEGLGYMPDDINNWRSAKLTVDGEEYNTEVKYHGDSSRHWIAPLKSYTIKTEKTKYVNQTRSFHLIIFETRLLTGYAAGMIAKDLGLFDVRNDIVVLKINGVIQGVYQLEESLDPVFLEKNEFSNCEIIQLTNNFITDHPAKADGDPNGIFYGGFHRTAFDYEISDIDLKRSDLDLKKTIFAVNNLYDALERKDPKAVLDFFDIDHLSSYEAFRLIIGGPHFVVGDNLRMAYCATDGKFYPIPRAEMFENLELERGGFERHMNTWLGDNIDIFYLLVQNDELRYKRNKIVYSYINNTDLLDRLDLVIEKYTPYAVSYKSNMYGSRSIKYRMNELRKTLANNMELIKRNLEYSKCYINIFEKENRLTLEVIPDSIAQIKFDYLRLNLLNMTYSGEITLHYADEGNNTLAKSLYVNESSGSIDLTGLLDGLYFSAGLDEDLFPKLRVYEIEIVFEDAKKVLIDDVDVGMRNDVTNRSIAFGGIYDDIYIKIADANDFYPDKISRSAEEFVQDYSEFNWESDSNKLVLLDGRYTLKRDMIIPKGLKLTINSGVEISIDEGKSIVSYSQVDILGTEQSPVVIKASDSDKPFGTFGIVGEKGSEVSIEWLELSGGKEKFINGLYFSGGLSIYHVDRTIIKNSKIANNKADDGLNIKYSDVYMEGCKLYGNYADQFDCDFCTGIIKDNEFDGSQDSNGDGLDFSGSKVLVKGNNLFKNKDKGISIGEDTMLIAYKNALTDNNMGIAVKDHSDSFIIDNTFKNNKIALSAYQKKPLFGGAKAYLFGNGFESNEKTYDVDEKSKLYDIKINDASYSDWIKHIEEEDSIYLFDKFEGIIQK